MKPNIKHLIQTNNKEFQKLLACKDIKEYYSFLKACYKIEDTLNDNEYKNALQALNKLTKNYIENANDDQNDPFAKKKSNQFFFNEEPQKINLPKKVSTHFINKVQQFSNKDITCNDMKTELAKLIKELEKNCAAEFETDPNYSDVFNRLPKDEMTAEKPTHGCTLF